MPDFPPGKAVTPLAPHVATSETNTKTIRQQATAAMAANRTYLALTAPTAAQNTAQIKRLTQECQALIRLALNLLDGTD